LAGRYADELDTDVSIPEMPTPPAGEGRSHDDDEDFSPRSVYR
jgi:hypothetical protein